MNESIGIFRRKRLLQNQNRRALDGDAGQGSRAPRAGVDVDSIMPDIGMRHRRVTVNHKLSMVPRGVEELVADPEQVVEILPLDRNGWANTSMYEQEISAAKTRAETLQQQFVRAWKGIPKAVVQFGFDHPRARINAVGCKRLHAADLQPWTETGRIAKEALHQALVVAAQANGAIFDQPDCQHIDHGLRIRAAVDVVAQIDLNGMRDRSALQVVIDACKDFSQQVGAAVDIADRIDANVRRCRGGDG